MCLCVQKLDLLAKESILLRDRQQLSRHVEFLQRQLVTPAVTVSGDTVGVSQLNDRLSVYMNGRCLTDDILHAALTDHHHHHQQQQPTSISAHENDSDKVVDDKDDGDDVIS